MSVALAWTLRAVGVAALAAAALRYVEWRLERWVIRGASRVLP